jgi:hypothetical protein
MSLSFKLGAAGGLGFSRSEKRSVGRAFCSMCE